MVKKLSKLICGICVVVMCLLPELQAKASGYAENKLYYNRSTYEISCAEGNVASGEEITFTHAKDYLETGSGTPIELVCDETQILKEEDEEFYFTTNPIAPGTYIYTRSMDDSFVLLKFVSVIKPAPATSDESNDSSASVPEPEKTVVVNSVTDNQTSYDSASDGAFVGATAWNLSEYVEQKYFDKALQMIEEIQPEAKEISIFTGTPVCFNEAIIKTINEGNKPVTYFFKFEGHLYSVTIPATVEAKSVLEESGEAGPLYVGQVLGTTKLIL